MVRRERLLATYAHKGIHFAVVHWMTSAAAASRDPHCRWPFKRGAVLGHWWPVDDGLTRSATPTCMPTSAVSEAGNVSDENLIRA
jgi:hypothetical protein